jgi:alpha-tubulin suppressor-like RCC1 family protein
LFIKTDNTLWGVGNGGSALLNASLVNVSSPIMLDNTFSWQYFNSVRGTFQSQTYAYANGLPQATPTVTASPTPTPTPSATPEALNWWLWNTNTSGNFANNTATNLGTLDLFYPSSQYDEISQGTVGVFARADDTIWHAGGNTGGNLGRNTVINYSSQIQVANAKYVAYGNGNSNGFRILNDGTLWSTGSGSNGVLGINSITNRSSPVQESLGKTDWVKVASTGTTTIGLDGSGRLWTTGFGTTGGLGNGAALSKSTFVQVGSDTNWADVRAGTGNVAANKSDGSWWVWGANASGQLGTNSTVNASSPIQFASDKTITKILLGGNNTYILTSANEIYACGSGANGIFGNSSVISRSSPVLMLGGPWIDFMPYHTATLAIKTDNTLWGMGNINNNISLGVAAVPASSPVQINATKTWIRFPYLPFNQLGGVAILAVEGGLPTPTPVIPSPTPSPSPSAISSCTGICTYDSQSDGSGGWVWVLVGSNCSSGCGCVAPVDPPTGPFLSTDIDCV